MSGKTNKEEEESIKKIELIANTKILGNPWQPSNWRIPLGKGEKCRRVVQELTMPNVHVRKFMNLFHELTNICLNYNKPQSSAFVPFFLPCLLLVVAGVEANVC